MEFLKKNAGFFNAGSSLLNGISQGVNGYYNSRSNSLVQTASLYNQAIPLYQQIGAQTQALQIQQATAYMNSGVDVSQGTAKYVINHTAQQGKMKMQEISNNLVIQVSNTKKIGQSQAISSLFSGIAQGVASGSDQLTNELLYREKNNYNYKNNNSSNTKALNKNTNLY